MRKITLLLCMAVLMACSGTGRKAVAEKPLTAAEREQLAGQCREFAFRFFQAQMPADTARGNFFVSPLSAAFAVGMTANGAAGETRQEMLAALQVQDIPLERWNRFCRELLDSLPKVDPQATVHIANSLWADEGFQLKGGFANVCREAYRAEACALDFGSAEAAAHVNRWCDEQTRHCIPRMADRLNPDARLLLLNALYFKNRWANVFSKRATRKEVFRALDGTAAPVDMMHRTADYGFAQSDYFDIARLPYGNGAFSMVVLLPSPQHTWQECVDALTAENWARWTASGMLLKKLDLKLPAFRMEVQTELNGSLQRLGMRRAFEPGQAELSAMADGDLCVSQVSQSAFLVVDEEGAEAAAATMTEVVLLSALEHEELPRPFHVDRPFVFWIEEQATGIPLFMGKVTRLGAR